MTSKNWFLADCLEEVKRRVWVLWLQGLLLFVCFPGALLLGLNSIRMNQMDDWEWLALRKSQFIETVFVMNEWIAMLIVLMAVLTGIQGFSWLQDKVQVNFYHSQPVSRNRRFLVIWFNGGMGFFVTYLANLVLGLVVTAAYGGIEQEILMKIPSSILAHFLLFFSIYHVTLSAVMLTGNVLVSLVLTGIFLGYEVCVRGLYSGYANQFFYTYSSRENDYLLDTLLSPLITFFRYQIFPDQGRYARIVYDYRGTMAALFVLTILYGCLAWFLYRKRPSEGHGRSLSFPILKEPLRVLLLVLAGLAGGLVFYPISGYSEVLGILGAMFVTLVGHTLLQMVYEVDFGAVFKKLPGLILSLILVISGFLIFRFDLFRYDQRIPDQDRVKSVSLNLGDRHWNHNRVLKDGTEVANWIYQEQEFQLTNLDPLYRILENRIEQEEVKGGAMQLEILFHLKNGNKQHRSFYLNREENLAYFDEIFHAEGYQEASDQVLEQDFVDEFNIFGADYTNGQGEYSIPQNLLGKLVDAYREDMKQAVFSDLYYDLPIGQLSLYGKGMRDPDFTNQWNIVIYPSFVKTKTLLQQLSIPPILVHDDANLASIKQISLFTTKTEEAAESQSLEQKSASKGGKKWILLMPEESGMTEDKLGEGDRPDEFRLISREEMKQLLDSAKLQFLREIDDYQDGIWEEEDELIVEYENQQGYGESRKQTVAYYLPKK